MDAHANEYAAAADGMAETYGRPDRPLPAVGDFVNGVTAGRRWCGHVLEVDANRLAVDCEGAWIVVHPRDVIDT